VVIAAMKFEAILFDCDGVLVDSESLTNGVLRDMLEESGWSMTLAQCLQYFVGKGFAVDQHTIAVEQDCVKYHRCDHHRS